VLYHPQYERPAVADFFRKAADAGKTALFSVGEWTMDFEGKVLDSTAALPLAMKPVDAAVAIGQTIARLKAAGIAPQTTCTMRGGQGPASMMPLSRGECRLLDGTVILASGQNDVMGDPIQKTLKVAGHEVVFDAVGVAAVRLDKGGKLEALAAGALKSFRGGGVTIELPERVDMALWRDNKGNWHGVLQDFNGPVPAALLAFTNDWLRLSVPRPLEQ